MPPRSILYILDEIFGKDRSPEYIKKNKLFLDKHMCELCADRDIAVEFAGNMAEPYDTMTITDLDMRPKKRMPDAGGFLFFKGTQSGVTDVNGYQTFRVLRWQILEELPWKTESKSTELDQTIN